MLLFVLFYFWYTYPQAQFLLSFSFIVPVSLLVVVTQIMECLWIGKARKILSGSFRTFYIRS